MNCYFCNNPLPLFQQGRVYDECLHCPLPVKHVVAEGPRWRQDEGEYLPDETEYAPIITLISIGITLKPDPKRAVPEYEILLYPRSNTCAIWNNARIILTLDHMPNVTPQNAEEKLLTLLTFS